MIRGDFQLTWIATLAATLCITGGLDARNDLKPVAGSGQPHSVDPGLSATNRSLDPNLETDKAPDQSRACQSLWVDSSIYRTRYTDRLLFAPANQSNDPLNMPTSDLSQSALLSGAGFTLNSECNRPQSRFYGIYDISGHGAIRYGNNYLIDPPAPTVDPALPADNGRETAGTITEFPLYIPGNLFVGVASNQMPHVRLLLGVYNPSLHNGPELSLMRGGFTGVYLIISGDLPGELHIMPAFLSFNTTPAVAPVLPGIVLPESQELLQREFHRGMRQSRAPTIGQGITYTFKSSYFDFSLSHFSNTAIEDSPIIRIDHSGVATRFHYQYQLFDLQSSISIERSVGYARPHFPPETIGREQLDGYALRSSVSVSWNGLFIDAMLFLPQPPTRRDGSLSTANEQSGYLLWGSRGSMISPMIDGQLDLLPAPELCQATGCTRGYDIESGIPGHRNHSSDVAVQLGYRQPGLATLHLYGRQLSPLDPHRDGSDNRYRSAATATTRITIYEAGALACFSLEGEVSLLLSYARMFEREAGLFRKSGDSIAFSLSYTPGGFK